MTDKKVIKKDGMFNERRRVIEMVNGCGMKAIKEVSKVLETKGLNVYFKETQDRFWVYRKPRQTKDNLKYIFIVWAGKRDVRPYWKFLAVKKSDKIDYNKLEEELKNFSAYNYMIRVE